MQSRRARAGGRSRERKLRQQRYQAKVYGRARHQDFVVVRAEKEARKCGARSEGMRCRKVSDREDDGRMRLRKPIRWRVKPAWRLMSFVPIDPQLGGLRGASGLGYGPHVGASAGGQGADQRGCFFDFVARLELRISRPPCGWPSRIHDFCDFASLESLLALL